MVDINKYIKEKFEEIKKEIAFRMELKAIEKCPVKTGTLRSSIQSGVDGNTVWVGAGFEKEVSYAKYVEYGTSRMKGQPFLRPAVFEVKKMIPKIVAKRLKN